MALTTHENLTPVADGSSFTRVVEALAPYIVGAAREAQAYAKCPAHPDRHPSLSVTWKVNRRGAGQTFVTCQRGCDYRAALEVVGLVAADCYDTPPFRGKSSNTAAHKPGQWQSTLKPRATSLTRKPVTWGKLRATYSYVDLSGRVLYDVRRWDGGDVPRAVRTYDEHGNATPGAPAPSLRVLYNLPDVRAAIAAGEPVYCAEGESDADAGREADDVTTTTNVFGAADSPARAAAVWLPQYVETLRGAHLVLIADRDPIEQGFSGYRHVLHVGDATIGVLASLRVLEPPLVKDWREHAAQGGRLADMVQLTREELVCRIAAADARREASADV